MSLSKIIKQIVKLCNFISRKKVPKGIIYLRYSKEEVD